MDVMECLGEGGVGGLAKLNHYLGEVGAGGWTFHPLFHLSPCRGTRCDTPQTGRAGEQISWMPAAGKAGKPHV